jgi:hypothetical protein
MPTSNSTQSTLLQNVSETKKNSETLGVHYELVLQNIEDIEKTVQRVEANEKTLETHFSLVSKNISDISDISESNKLLRLKSELSKKENAKSIQVDFQSRIIFDDEITPHKTENVIVVVQGYTDACTLSPITQELASSTKSNMLQYRPWGYDTRYTGGIEELDFNKDIEQFEEYIQKYALQIGNKIIYYGTSFGARFVLTSLPKFKSSITNIILNSGFLKLPELGQNFILFLMSDEEIRNLALGDTWYTVKDKIKEKYPDLSGIFDVIAPSFPYGVFPLVPIKTLQELENDFPISKISIYDQEEAIGAPFSLQLRYVWVYLYKVYILKKYENSISELKEANIRFLNIGDNRDTVIDEKYNREILNTLKEKGGDIYMLNLEDYFDIQGKVTIDDKEYNLDQLDGKNSYSIYGNNAGPGYHATGAGYNYSVKAIPKVNEFILQNIKL